MSYGTSSYGYDVRCAEDFKIFTNINSTIVDPKSFDEKSFVDFKGPVCIIPPNSFALASTVEYFRIPRSVLDGLSGKMRHRRHPGGRCRYRRVRADHRNAMGQIDAGLDDWRLKAAKVSAFMPQGSKEVFELRTRAGLRIRATANHPFRMLKGWVPLERAAARRSDRRRSRYPGVRQDCHSRLGGESVGTDDLGRAVRYTRAQSDLHHGGSGHGRSAESVCRGLRHGSRDIQRTLRLSPRQSAGPRRDTGTQSCACLAAESRLECRRGRQVCSAERIHGAREFGSVVPAVALQRRRQRLSLRMPVCFSSTTRNPADSSRMCIICCCDSASSR